MVRASYRRSEGCGFESRLGTRIFFWVKIASKNIIITIKYALLTISCILTYMIWGVYDLYTYMIWDVLCSAHTCVFPPSVIALCLCFCLLVLWSQLPAGFSKSHRVLCRHGFASVKAIAEGSVVSEGTCEGHEHWEGTITDCWRQSTHISIQ